jgi:signal transduction histidine kinase
MADTPARAGRWPDRSTADREIRGAGRAGERDGMGEVRDQRRAAPVPDALLTLDAEFADILALLDRSAAIRRIVAMVPELTGVAMSWVGEPAGEDEIVLGKSVNTPTRLVEGLVVPVGAGLGGKVLVARRPMWVSDYCADREITHHFKAQAMAEGMRAMIAVPIVHDGRLLGVLYGANSEETLFGDRTAHALEQVAARTAAAEVVAERARHVAEVAVHEERRRLALDLHDTVGAMLFTLGAGIRRLGDEPGLDAVVRARLTAIEEQAMEASVALRGSLRVLSAPPGEVALGVALREHCKAFADRTGTGARMITLTELPVLPASRIRALADAAREALLNVEKHARAQSVVVSVFALRDGVAVTVSDDGVGFTGHGAGNGLGLPATGDRLARVGGTLTVTRNDDDGVTVQAWVPA